MSKAANWRVRKPFAKLLPHWREARRLDFCVRPLSGTRLDECYYLDPIKAGTDPLCARHGAFFGQGGGRRKWVMSQLLPRHCICTIKDSSCWFATIIQTHVEAAVMCANQDSLVERFRGYASGRFERQVAMCAWWRGFSAKW
jgi:hypothetical protein